MATGAGGIGSGVGGGGVPRGAALPADACSASAVVSAGGSAGASGNGDASGSGGQRRSGTRSDPAGRDRRPPGTLPDGTRRTGELAAGRRGRHLRGAAPGARSGVG